MVDLKTERIKRAWTQGDLSYRAGISRSYVAQLETGRVPYTVYVAKRLGKALGIDWKEFFD